MVYLSNETNRGESLEDSPLKTIYAYDADFCLVFAMKVLLEPWSWIWPAGSQSPFDHTFVIEPMTSVIPSRIFSFISFFAADKVNIVSAYSLFDVCGLTQLTENCLILLVVYCLTYCLMRQRYVIFSKQPNKQPKIIQFLDIFNKKFYFEWFFTYFSVEKPFSTSSTISISSEPFLLWNRCLLSLPWKSMLCNNKDKSLSEKNLYHKIPIQVLTIWGLWMFYPQKFDNYLRFYPWDWFFVFRFVFDFNIRINSVNYNDITTTRAIHFPCNNKERLLYISSSLEW